MKVGAGAKTISFGSATLTMAVYLVCVNCAASNERKEGAATIEYGLQKLFLHKFNGKARICFKLEIGYECAKMTSRVRIYIRMAFMQHWVPDKMYTEDKVTVPEIHEK